MGRVQGSILEGIRGKVGNLVFYQLDGQTYVRKAPGKQSKATKARTSEAKKISQSVNTQTHKFLRFFAHLIRFGFQEWEIGGRKAYHAAVSFTAKNSFSFVGSSREKVLDIFLVKLSSGSLLGPEEPKAERTATGVLFTWRNNSWIAGSNPRDEAFLVLIHEHREKSVWEFKGNSREKESHLLALPFPESGDKWHAFLAFSQENAWTKNRTFSDSVYLGEV
ncbi:DUF6266 family protein [Algoriphagus sp. A40]|uniref:DUF6266 family protein n=1 Tax=Algoriphagus sp. A40 TaxID=1945863 RepID=UPI0009876595|nr:DUF6266 family protein [Algoriphagus sp. A40]OOG73790.1 hypothetical protein B0E43_13185 [Algoriphagus sp. A40]